MSHRLQGQDWLTAPATRAVMAALAAAGGPDCARFVGGCVRNALIGAPIDDIDIATTLTPDAVVAALKAAGLRSVPTGIEHGTVTAISEHQPFEITSLRRDVSTDGRRATVAFTTDWSEDAGRRDFRLNALYADADGDILDPTGQGVDDAMAGRIVFVGEPEGASARTICASCASIGSMPGTGGARPMRRRSRPVRPWPRASSSCRRSGCPRNC